MIISHGFVKKMGFLGNGKDYVDHFVRNHGKTNCVGHIKYKVFASHHNPGGLICPPWYEYIPPIFLSWSTILDKALMVDGEPPA